MKHISKAVLAGCILFIGCGDVGSSSINSSQDQTSSINPDQSCSLDCTIEPDKTIIAEQQCGSEAPKKLILDSESGCDTITEANSASDSVDTGA